MNLNPDGERKSDPDDAQREKRARKPAAPSRLASPSNQGNGRFGIDRDDATGVGPVGGIDVERRVRADHSLQMIREDENVVLDDFQRNFDALYPRIGRKLMTHEQAMRASIIWWTETRADNFRLKHCSGNGFGPAHNGMPKLPVQRRKAGIGAVTTDSG
jgi:hypothetical protein